METTEDWLRRIGSAEAHELRVIQRMSGVINAPKRVKGGICTLGRPHSLYCKCEVCIPPWLKEEMLSWPVVTKGMYEAHHEPKPRKVITKESKPAKKRRSKWESRGNLGN